MSYICFAVLFSIFVTKQHLAMVIGNGRTVHNGGKENGNIVFGRIVNHFTWWEGVVYQFPIPLCKMIHNPTKYDVAILLPTIMHSPTVANYPACSNL